ncbi:MAG TPA: tyrosine--tRNA ligase [bacterium]
MTAAPNLLDTLRERGFIEQVAGPEEELRALLATPASAYIGFDPTASSLHVGSLVPIMSLVHLQRAGHRPVALVGGGTGLVGDPSGRTELRRVMTREEVAANAAALRAQLGRFVDFSQGRAALVNNADWLVPLNYLEFLRDVGRQFSVNRMLAADAYRTRYESADGLNFLEFNYMLLQAYDFHHLCSHEGCRLQMGGSDQWGNIVAGIDLIRRLGGPQAFGVTFPLITTAAGAKMGKTAAGAVWLDGARTSPYDYYQFWVNTDDRDLERFLALFTLLPMAEVRALAAAAASDPRPAKRRLAFEATRLAHGGEEARRAEAASAALFGGGAIKISVSDGIGVSDAAGLEALKNVPNFELPAAELAGGIEAFDLFHRVGLAKSRGEARRLIEGGGAYVGGRQVAAFNERIGVADAADGRILLRAGKKKYLLLRLT